MAIESKTFKNPGVTTYMDYHHVGANETDDYSSYAFDRKYWDMEVKFVRKPPPFEPGYYMRRNSDYDHPNASWLPVMPASSHELFWEKWKRVEITDVEDAG